MNIATTGACTSAGMSADTLAAYTDVQNRLLQATSSPLMERYERSLDEFLRNPSRTGNPDRLANNASGNAGKVVRDRARRISHTEIDLADDRATAAFTAADLRVFVGQTNGSLRNRLVSLLLLGGAEVVDVAKAVGLTEASAHVLISRVRSSNRQALDLQEGGLGANA